jgi:hypothetical protein
MLSNQVLRNLHGCSDFCCAFASDNPFQHLFTSIWELSQAMIKVSLALSAFVSSFRLLVGRVSQGELYLFERNHTPSLCAPPGFPDFVPGDAFYVGGEWDSILGLVASSFDFLEGSYDRFLKDVLVRFESVVLHPNKPLQGCCTTLLLPLGPGIGSISLTWIAGRK